MRALLPDCKRKLCECIPARSETVRHCLIILVWRCI
jgi:hypothetical protein